MTKPCRGVQLKFPLRYLHMDLLSEQNGFPSPTRTCYPNKWPLDNY